MRLGDLDSLKEAISYHCEYLHDNAMDLEDILNLIDNAPAVSIDWGVVGGDRTVYARPQGEWLLPNFYGDGVSYECNKCHIPHEGYIGKDGKPRGYDYCPNCGAKMGGDKE